MKISTVQKVIIVVTAVIVFMLLGLSSESQVLDNRIIRTKTEMFTIYGFVLGLSQEGYCRESQVPPTEMRQGLIDYTPIVAYKLHLIIVTSLMGYLFFATFREKRRVEGQP